MKLIVGLGNPGKQYENTRHNVGFLVLDTLINTDQWQSVSGWKHDKGRECEEAIVKMPNGETVILAKPQTMMNASGRAVSKLLNFFKVTPKDLLVIHDDLDLKLGEFKLQLAKGPQAHNGVNSIEEVLGTTEFWRLRVGVDNREPVNRTPGEEYVLQAFRPEEQMILDKLIKDSLLSEFSQWLMV
ncbi:MAG: aminoacyl-tRNA hydrolase [Patescibacteria group bacterium]